MRHELAYILGQMRQPAAGPTLAAVLADEGDDALVRHEAAEALGAIGDPAWRPLLQRLATHVLPEIAETCVIALDLLAFREGAPEPRPAGQDPAHHYLSVDPAPPLPHDSSTGVPEV